MEHEYTCDHAFKTHSFTSSRGSVKGGTMVDSSRSNGCGSGGRVTHKFTLWAAASVAATSKVM